MIRRLARCIREYKWAALLSPLCMVGEVTMEVIIPLVMADLYDYGVVMQDMGVVAVKSAQLILLAVLSLSFGVASAIFSLLLFIIAPFSDNVPIILFKLSKTLPVKFNVPTTSFPPSLIL